MAATARDQQRLRLLAGGLLAAALTILAMRTIAAGREVGTRPVPVADLRSLLPFLRPLTDTTVVAQGASSAMVLTRDPFAPTGVARLVSSPRTTTSTGVPRAAGGERWVVSTILFEGSRKSAIVNNAWVTVGDTLGGGSRLTAVERDHIVVTDANGVRHNVPIQGGESW